MISDDSTVKIPKRLAKNREKKIDPIERPKKRTPL